VPRSEIKYALRGLEISERAIKRGREFYEQTYVFHQCSVRDAENL
jgi:hypothetical protein